MLTKQAKKDKSSVDFLILISISMIDNYVWVVVLVAVGLVIGSLCLTISYQHMKIRESIIKRAKRRDFAEIEKLEDALDEMLGPELRAFGSATDAEFAEKLFKILSK